MAYQPLTYRTNGGDKMVVASGGELDVESGGSLKLAGTAVTATAAEINAIAGGGLSAAELGMLDSGNSDGAGLAFQDTQLSAAQLNGLAAANITVVAAPAAGLAAFPVGWSIWLDHGGTDFVQTNGADHLALRYSAAAEICELGTEAQCTALLEASADAALAGAVSAIAVPVAATAIDLDNNGAAEYTTGDGTLSIRVWYRTFPMAAFT